MKNYLTTSIWLVIFVAVFGLACQPEAEIKTSAAPLITEPAVETITEPPAVAEEPTVEATVEAPAVIKPPAETTTDVAVTINGVDITESEVEAKIKPQLEKMLASSRTGAQLPASVIEPYKKQLRQQALEGMIVEHLLDEKVKVNNIVITEEDLNEHLEKTASQQNLSLEDLKALVEASGQTFDQVKQRIRKGLGYQKLMETQFVGKVNVTGDDAQKYYFENTEQFETPEQVRASHILIQPDTTDPDADPNEAKARAETKAQDLLKQIKAGADFATLARDSSSCPSGARGGDLNFFGRGNMVPPFEQAAFKLKVGQVSDVVETRFGYHIIKVTDRKDAGVVTFEQAKEDIINGLTQQKQGELAVEYIESLKDEANIAYPAGKEPSSVSRRP